MKLVSFDYEIIVEYIANGQSWTRVSGVLQ